MSSDLPEAPSATEQRSPPTIRFPSKPSNLSSATRFAGLLAVLAQMHRCTRYKLRMTKRDLFYQDVALFGTQRTVDRYVEDISAALSVRREDLGVIAAAKGLIVGSVKVWRKTEHLQPIRDIAEPYEIPEARGANGIADVQWQLVLRSASDPCLIPHIPSSMPASSLCWSLGCTYWILVVEKEATFRHLAERNFATDTTRPGLLITAKGYPDLDTRAFLHRLASAEPCVPVYVLTDYDPDGLAIAATYARGSAAMARRAKELTLPGLVWIGIKSGDVVRAVDGEAQGVLRLSRRDRQLARGMLSRDGRAGEAVAWTGSKEWRGELRRMLMLNVKAEIQILDEREDLCRWVTDRMGL